MRASLFRANRDLVRCAAPPHTDGAGFSAIRAAVEAEQRAYANAATLDDLAAKAEAAGLADAAAGYRRGARAERAAGRAAVGQYRHGLVSTFDGSQPDPLPGQLSLGDD